MHKEFLQLSKTQISQFNKWAEDLNRHFSKDIKWLRKKCSSSLSIREMKIKIQGDITSQLLKWQVPKWQEIEVLSWRCGKVGTLVHYQWECKMLQPLWKTIWRFLKKLKIERTNDQQSHLCVYIQNNWNKNLEDVICTFMFTASLFRIAKR